MSVHCLILVQNAWKIFVSSQLENRCTADPAKDSLEHLELNARTMEQSLKWRKGHPLWLAFHPIYYHLWPGTCNIISIFPQLSTADQEMSFISIRCVIWISTKITVVSTLHFVAHFFSMIRTVTLEIWILTLVTTAPCANNISTRGLPFIPGSWISQIVQPNSRCTIPQFLCSIPQSTTVLVTIYHSIFPSIYCVTACKKCTLSNALSPPSLGSFISTSSEGS